MNCNRRLYLPTGIVVMVAVAASLPQFAWAVDSDVLLASANGHVVIGAANDLGTADENFNLTTNVFVGIMTPDFPPFDPADYGGDEPGFFALNSGNVSLPPGASALPGSAQVTIQFPSFTVGAESDSLFYWDGAGAVDFQPISLAQPGIALSLVPNPIATTHVDGSLHQHSAWELDNGGVGVPADGVYLLSPTASVVGLADSKPYYMLFLADAGITNEDDAEAVKDGLDSGDPIFNGKDYSYFYGAADYVRDNLAVPEPSAAALLGLACAALVTSTGRR